MKQRKATRKISVVVGIILFVISLVLIIRAVSNKSTDNDHIQIITKNISVKTITVQPQNFTPTISTTGQVFAKNKVEIYADVTGTLLKTSKPFKTGVAFRKGEIMLQIDSRERRLVVEASKADFLSLIISLAPDIQNDYPESFEEWKSYIDDFDISKPMKPLPEPKSEKEKYFFVSRKVTFQYLSIKSSEVNLQKYTITAPFDGVILSGDQNPGALLRNGQKLGEFIELGLFEVELDILTTQMRNIKIGSPITISSNSHNALLHSKIARIGKAVDPKTQTIKIYADVKDNKFLKDGLFINAEIELPEIENAFLIDRKYLTEKGQLFQIKNGSLYLLSPKIVTYKDNRAILTEIPTGTVIINQLLPNAYEGMKVIISKSESL